MVRAGARTTLINGGRGVRKFAKKKISKFADWFDAREYKK